MATVTQRPAANLSESSRKVRDPLGRLRGYIRTYVITESLASLLLCLAVCFWAGLLLDYGSFLLGLDWVRDLPRWLRAGLLAVGLCVVAFVAELRKSFKRTDARRSAAGGTRAGRKLDFFAISEIALLALFFIVFVGFAIHRDIADGLVRTAETSEDELSARAAAAANGAWCAGLVAVFLVVFAGLIIARRMTYEFSDPALALVLEKRFPAILGDRLITAVELADTKRAAKYGYSEAMVEQTIHDAARCVDRLNIREVFDWKRLYLRTAFAAVVTVGIYALTVGSLLGIGAAQGKDAGAQFTALNDSAVIWTERNVLLNNERWPTRSIVELQGFPLSGEKKIGKGSDGGKDLTRVGLNAKALEYVFHDSAALESWRPLLLSDLADKGVDNLSVLDMLPFSWKEGNWTVDHLKFMSKHEPAVQQMNAATQAGMTALLEEIDELAEQPSMSRTLRKLIVPAEVVVRYRTVDGMTKTSATMQTKGNNEYSVELSLKDSVTFHLAAEDYVSDTRKITLVPPPRIAKLASVENRPAYLYHLADTDGRILPSVMASTAGMLAAPGNALMAASALPPERPYDDDRFFLGARKQRGKPIAVNVGGELKPKIAVPATTDVVLLAETDKELEPGTVKLDALGAAALLNVKPRETGSRTFEISIPNVREEISFRLAFRDTDGALGIQELQIVIDEDSPPSIDSFKPEVVRELGGKFKVTPTAVIPFTFFVKDPKFGLSGLDFVYTIKEAPSPGEQGRRASRAAAAVGLVLSGPEAPLTSYIYNFSLPATLTGSEEVIEGRMPVADFKATMENHRRFRDFLPDRNKKDFPRRWADTEAALSQEMSFTSPAKMILSYNLPELRDLDKYLLDHDMRIEESEPLKGMDLSLIRRVDSSGLLVPLKARPLEIQRRYDMTVTLEARDTNVARSLRGRHESQPIAFEIVSEIELVFDIHQEEQRLYDELFKAVADLKRGSEQLQTLRFDIPLTPPPGRDISFDSFSVRTEEVQKTVNESKRMTAKVTSDYEKVLREFRTNRIDVESGDAVRKTKEKIVRPLGKILVGDYRDEMDKAVGFTVAADGLNYLRKAVDNTSANDVDRLAASKKEAEAAEKDLERLITALSEVLLEMKGIVDLGEVLKGLNLLELRQRESVKRIVEEKERVIEQLFKFGTK